MPIGPKGQKRPADTVGCAISVARIAVGEIEDTIKEPTGKKNSGKAGAKARAEALTKEQRSAIAKKAAESRWR
ncbi:MAG: RNA-binding protein [Alphaproteobacteria bacterium]|nr:RNA-binding protein [Alphaproteobacteria bacterium]